MNKYPALSMIASLLKTIAILVILFGIGVSLWFMIQADRDTLSRIIAIGGIVGSIIVGLIVYSMSDFFRCVMDIEANTRPKAEEPAGDAAGQNGSKRKWLDVMDRAVGFFRAVGYRLKPGKKAEQVKAD